MTIETSGIKLSVDSNQVNAANQSLERFSKAGDRSAKSVTEFNRATTSLKGTLHGIIAALGVRELIQYADTYQQVNARLKLVTGSQEQFVKVQRELIRSANETRNSLADNIDLYAKLSIATQKMVVTDRDRLRVNENINKALTIGGSKGVSAQLALIQLGQGLASGTLRGEELRSVLEQTPRLALAIADGLGKSVNQLKKLGEQDKLTSEAVFGALLSQSEKLDAQFARIPVTIGGAFQVASNRMTEFIGVASQTSGAGQAIAKTILLAANNLELLTSAAVGFVTLKFSQAILGAVAALKTNIASSVAYASATKAAQIATAGAAAQEVQRAVALGNLARAQAAESAAKLASLATTNAAIVAARAELVIKLQSTQASIASATAQLAVAKSMGALSSAIAARNAAEASIVASQAQQVKQITELARLSAQQAAVQKSITAATAAQTAATVAQTTATTAATAAQAKLGTAAAAAAAAGSIFTRTLAVLGGPIGVITTALTLGATAWALWGSQGVAAVTKVKQGFDGLLKSKINDDLAYLKAIEEDITRIRSNPKITRADVLYAKELEEKRDRLRREISSSRAQLQDYQSEVARLENRSNNEELARLNTPALIRERQQAALEAFLTENATDSEKFAEAVKKAKKELGELYSPEVEKRLRARFFKGKEENPDFLGFKVADIQRDLDKVISAFSVSTSILDARRQAGFVTDKEFYSAKIALIQESAEAQISYIEKENKALRGAGKDTNERLTNQAKVADNEKKISIIRGDIAVQTTILRMEEDALTKARVSGFEAAEVAAQSYLDTIRLGQQRELDSAGIGKVMRERMAGLQQIQDRYEQQRRDLQEQRREAETLGTMNPENQKRFDDDLQRINRFQELALSSYDSYFERRLKQENDFNIGAREFVVNYTDNVKNVAKTTEDFFNRTFSSLEATLLSFLQTGKFGFADLARSIVADLTAIVIKQQLANAVAAASPYFGKSSFVGGILNSIITAGSRAIGGPVSGGRAYRVNEKGPEILQSHGKQWLIPSANGSVHPAGGATITLSPNIYIEARADSGHVRELVVQGIQASVQTVMTELKSAGVM